MPITNAPVSLPYLLERIEHWQKQEANSTCIQYQTTCELIITELQFAIDYAKGHS